VSERPVEDSDSEFQKLIQSEQDKVAVVVPVPVVARLPLPMSKAGVCSGYEKDASAVIPLTG
jgi:hypothetical protein